jgi:hypothetical protein
MMPEGWKYSKMSALIDKIVSGVSLSGEERPAFDGEAAVLTLSSISDGSFHPERYKVISDEESDKLTVCNYSRPSLAVLQRCGILVA